MSLNLELTADEARLLHRQLEVRVQSVARELAGTSKREMQHELAVDEAALHAIVGRLGALIASAGT